MKETTLLCTLLSVFHFMTSYYSASLLHAAAFYPVNQAKECSLRDALAFENTVLRVRSHWWEGNRSYMVFVRYQQLQLQRNSLFCSFIKYISYILGKKVLSHLGLTVPWNTHGQKEKQAGYPLLKMFNRLVRIRDIFRGKDIWSGWKRFLENVLASRRGLATSMPNCREDTEWHLPTEEKAQSDIRRLWKTVIR